MCAIQKGVVVGAGLWTENRISHTKLYFSFLSYKILQKQNPQKIAVKYISRTGDQNPGVSKFILYHCIGIVG